MIPQICEYSDATFNGISAPLNDTISCIVTEERNGIYELKAVVGMNDPHFAEIQNNKCILAKANDTDENLQAFRIYAIETNINGRATIYAEHVSRRMKYIPLNPTSYLGSLSDVLQTTIPNAVSVNNPFTLSADFEKHDIFFEVTTPTSLFAMLTGTRGSLTDLCNGGEWHFDNFTATLKQNRGSDNGVEISYGKNLTDMNQENRIENTSTGIYPYWTGKDENDVEIVVTIPDNPIVYATGHETQDFERILPVDMSDRFKDAPTAAQLRTAAESYVTNNNIMTPKVSLKVSFVPLWEAMGYETLEAVERVSLCDTVTVRFEKLGVLAKAKIVKTEYDVLTERYIKITIGDAKQSFTERLVSDINSAASTGGSGSGGSASGNAYWHFNDALLETHHADAVYLLRFVASADAADGDTKWAMSVTRNSDSKRCFILRYGGAVECTALTVSELTSGTGSTVVANSSGRLYISSSSKRYKDYLADMTDEEAEKLYDLPVVQFKYKDGYLDENDEMYNKPMHGFFAEDVADLFSDGGVHDADGNVENYSERAIIARLVKIVQKQHEEIEQLKHLIGGAT